MKKILFLCAFLALSVVVAAQPSKGKIMLGGTAGFHSLSTYGIDAGFDKGRFGLSTFSINPGFDYFVGDKLSVGATLGYSNTWFKVISEGENVLKLSLQNFSVSVTANYYIPVAGRFYISLNSSAEFGYNLLGGKYLSYDYMMDDYSNEDLDLMNGWTLGVRCVPTMNYFVTPSLLIRASFGGLRYQMGRMTPDRDMENIMELKTGSHYFGFDWGKFEFGVAYCF